MPLDAVIVCAALAAALTTAAMALATNLPFALAPGLGINAIVAFDIIIGRDLPWQVGMAVVVIEGLIAVVLVLAGLRTAIMEAVPMALKLAIGVGIELFIALVGLREGGIVVNDPATGIGLGDLTRGAPLIATAASWWRPCWWRAQAAGADHPRRGRGRSSASSSACSKVPTAWSTCRTRTTSPSSASR